MKSLKVFALLLTFGIVVSGCTANQVPSEQFDAASDSETSAEVVEDLEAEIVSRKETCGEAAKEFQAYFESDASFADSARALALGLTIVSSDAESDLAKHLDIYIDLMQKVDSSVKTNSAFQALVEPRHATAAVEFFAMCEAEGILIN